MVFHDPTTLDCRNQKSIFQLTTNIKQGVQSLESKATIKKLTMSLPQGINIDKMKKINEVIFRNSGWQVTLNIPRSTKKEQNKRNKNRKGEAIIIEAKETTYADTLKVLKEKITENEAKEDKKCQENGRRQYAPDTQPRDKGNAKNHSRDTREH